MPNSKFAQIKPIQDRFKVFFSKSVLRYSVIGITLVSSSVLARTPLGLDEAINKTLKQHPDLIPYVHSDRIAAGLKLQAEQTTPLAINVMVEDALGTGDFSGVSGMQTSISIAWLLEDEVIASRSSLAANKSSIAKVEKQIKALDLAAETAQYFIVLLSQQQQLKLAKLAEHQATKVLEVIANRVKLGKLNLVDELRAKADLSKKSLVVEDLTHEIEASKAQLAAQWQGNTEFSVKGELQAIPALIQLKNTLQKLTSNPRLKLFATQQRIAQSEIKLARASANPPWRLRAGLKRNEAVDDFGFSAGITIPWGSENRNLGKITALQAKQSQQQDEADAWYQRISTQLLLLTHKLKHNRHVVEGLSEETIPLLQMANEKAEESYKVGSYRYTDWYAVQQELLTAQAELIQAYTNIQLFNIELERLTGASVAM